MTYSAMTRRYRVRVYPERREALRMEQRIRATERARRITR